MAQIEPLSLADALDVIDQAPVEDADDEVIEEGVDDGAEDATEGPDEESAVDDPATDDADDEPEEADEDSDDEEDAEPKTVIDAPQFWDAEGKEAFAKLPKEAQEAVAAYEKQRISAVGRKMNEVAEERKAVQAQNAQLTERLTSLETFSSELDRKLEVYEKLDWVAAAKELSPQEYQQHHANYEQLQRQRAQAQQVRQAAETEQLKVHTQENIQVLREKAGDVFFDGQGNPKQEVFSSLTGFLQENGYDQQTLQWASASDLMIAHKAMLYDQMQAAAKKAASQPKADKQKPRNVRPRSASPKSSNSARKALANKRSLSVAEAMQLLE